MTIHRVHLPLAYTAFFGVMGLVTASCLPACRGSGPDSEEGQTVSTRMLPSGKIEVIAARAQGPPDGTITFLVDYVTELPTSDHVALARQANEVFAEFIQEARKANARTMLVRATDTSRNSSAVFPFTAEKDGQWERPEVRTLQSGKEVVVVSVNEHDGKLFVDYVTDLPIRDYCGLASEVDQVWAEVREEADEMGVDKIFVSPAETPLDGGSVSYAFLREGNGDWLRQKACPGDADYVHVSDAAAQP